MTTVVDIPRKVFFHLLGKTGTGKSSTGNTILGWKAFKASASSVAFTLCIQRAVIDFDESEIVVVDGPGLVGIDTGFSYDNMMLFKQICDENHQWGHVFLLVLRYGERFTAEDQEMINRLRKQFGNDVFKKHGIVLVTCGDNFEADFEDEDTTFDSWCRGQGGDFGALVASCDRRVLLVDNIAKAARNGNLLGRINEYMPQIDYGSAALRSAHADSNHRAIFERIREWFRSKRNVCVFVAGCTVSMLLALSIISFLIL